MPLVESAVPLYKCFHPLLPEILKRLTPPSRFHRGSRSCVSSPPPCPPSRCPNWPRPCRATWGPWSPCCPPRSWATPAGWCRSLAGRAAWARGCRRGWRGEPATRGTGSVSAVSVWGMWHMLEIDRGVFFKAQIELMWCVQARMGGYKNTLNISGQSSGAKHLLLFGSRQSKED